MTIDDDECERLEALDALAEFTFAEDLMQRGEPGAARPPRGAGRSSGTGRAKKKSPPKQRLRTWDLPHDENKGGKLTEFQVPGLTLGEVGYYNGRQPDARDVLTKIARYVRDGKAEWWKPLPPGRNPFGMSLRGGKQLSVYGLEPDIIATLKQKRHRGIARAALAGHARKHDYARIVAIDGDEPDALAVITATRPECVQVGPDGKVFLMSRPRQRPKK